VLEPFTLPFVQRGLAEILLLSVGAGVLGVWIVLRGLSFYAHAVGTAAFPGLVLAEGLGFAAPLGALGAAAVFSVGVTRLDIRRGAGYDGRTALVLVGSLSLGVILASDVFRSGANVETLLFGSLLAIGTPDLVTAGATTILVLLGAAVLGPRWLMVGFDPSAARGLKVRASRVDAVLLGLVAGASVAAISAVGALLTTALFVVPAATARLWTRRLLSWQVTSVALVALEGTAGLWLSVQTNAPPGATIAVVSGGVFAAAALVRWTAARRWGPARGLPAVSWVVVAAALLGGCAGGGGGQRADGARPIDVVATTTQLGDVVRQVGGHAVAVHQVLQPNTDPHDYEPRPADVQATAEARAVFVSGDNLDAWMTKVVSESGTRAVVVDLGSAAPVKLAGEATGGEASRYDPHWWHDPRNVEAVTTRVRDTLVRIDPSGRKQIERGAQAYAAKVRALDAAIARCLRAVPAAQRKLVTDHDAFNYFARRYGIDVVGAVIPSQSTQAQPSGAGVADLSSIIRRERVRAVFPESSVSPRLAQAIARQTGASAVHTLYGDTLGPAGSPGASYLGMEATNADAMARGFTGGSRGCRAPAG